ncbi:hypothetical protein TrVE_jg1384 [Triparma verrucosa]|uniref:Uncharacterized protein n=1 Tax=Triparma verrucosa TaxID=1606542 RepID=A0A9W7KST3_9STRA|nr:hypothetical protein TrVE_jg1384 [Triparma verrucosa]
MLVRNIRNIASRRMSTMTVSQEMPDLPLTSPTPSTYGPTLTTTLPSGLKILTSPNASSLTVTYTTPFTPSPSSLPSRYMSFKSSSLGSTLKTSRTFEDLGASTFTSHTRTSISKSFTSPEVMMGLMSDRGVDLGSIVLCAGRVMFAGNDN